MNDVKIITIKGEIKDYEALMEGPPISLQAAPEPSGIQYPSILLIPRDSDISFQDSVDAWPVIKIVYDGNVPPTVIMPKPKAGSRLYSPVVSRTYCLVTDGER